MMHLAREHGASEAEYDVLLVHVTTYIFPSSLQRHSGGEFNEFKGRTIN